MKFTELSNSIKNVHIIFARQAGRSVDMALTMRNWLIGFYIKEYEQKGLDRAEYGTKLLSKLSEDLQKAKIPSTAYSSLKKYRHFYDVYQAIGSTLSSQFEQVLKQLELPSSISSTVSSQFKITESHPQANNIPQLSPEKLLSNLSFSHFVELLKIEDSLKRSFYEIESIRNNWGSRELRRQISTLYYERLGLSKNKANIAKMITTGTYAHNIQDVIREPYMFEFVGTKKDDITESNLAEALLRKLNMQIRDKGSI